MFKQIGQLSQLIRQAQEMGGKFQEINERLKRHRVTGASGGGLVEVEMTGTGEVVRLTIDPMLIERREHEMLEDLIPAAVNQAQGKAKQCFVDAIKELAGGLNLQLPGLNEALSQLANGNTDP